MSDEKDLFAFMSINPTPPGPSLLADWHAHAPEDYRRLIIEQLAIDYNREMVGSGKRMLSNGEKIHLIQGGT